MFSVLRTFCLRLNKSFSVHKASLKSDCTRDWIRDLSSVSPALLLRDYIQQHLYDPASGYFTQHVSIGGEENKGLAEPIDFNHLLDQDDFLLKLKAVYKKGAGAWLTPVEVFHPWYGYAIADHILKTATCDGTVSPPTLEIFEIGSGSGTCMVDILNRIRSKDESLFRRTTYTSVEISARLAEAQMQRAEEAGFGTEQCNVIHADFLTLDKELPHSGAFLHQAWLQIQALSVCLDENVFVLAFELLDNLPHDKVIFDQDDRPWEAVIVPLYSFTSSTLKKATRVMDFILSDTARERQTPKSETQRELFRPAADSLVLKMIALLEESEEKLISECKEGGLVEHARSLLGYGNLRYSKTQVLTPGSAVRTRQGIVYVPTGQLLFLEALKRCIPRHSLILSDFDSLPGLVMKGAGGPVVQSVEPDRQIYERSHYLLPSNVSADIFFPTDFHSLRVLYQKMIGVSAEVQSASEFFKPFKESLQRCRTMSGYCPLIEYYSNTSYLVSRFPFNGNESTASYRFEFIRTIQPLLTMTTSDCRLVHGATAAAAQITLATMILGSLLYKRQRERPKRPFLIWVLDVSKQGISATTCHVINMTFALAAFHNVSSDEEDSEASECAWYFVQFNVDNAIGVPLTILSHTAIIAWSRAYIERPSFKCGQAENENMTLVEIIANCGSYGTPPKVSRWAVQIGEWIFSVIAARSVCGCLVVLLSDIALKHAAALVDRVFCGHDVLNVYVVIVFYPLALSTTVAWILDGILKRTDTYDSNDPELTVHILEPFEEAGQYQTWHDDNTNEANMSSTETSSKTGLVYQ